MSLHACDARSLPCGDRIGLDHPVLSTGEDQLLAQLSMNLVARIGNDDRNYRRFKHLGHAGLIVSKFKPLKDLPTPGGSWNNTCPAGLSVYHPVSAKLLEYAIEGCPVKT